MITGPDRTYHACRSIFSSFFSLIFLFISCGGLNWLHVSFLLHVKYSISYRIVPTTPARNTMSYYVPWYLIITLAKVDRFLPLVSTLTRDIDIAILTVCRLSVRCVPVFCGNGLTYITFSSLHGSRVIVVLSGLNIFAKFRRVYTPPAKSRWGIKHFRDFRPIKCYISQTIQDSAIVTVSVFVTVLEHSPFL